MRTLYIHVGLPKTGSSSVQRFLVDNRDTLLAAGLGLGPYMTLASGKSLPLRQAAVEVEVVGRSQAPPRCRPPSCR